MTDLSTHQLRQEAAAAEALLANFADILGEDEEAKKALVEGETDLFETVTRALNRLTVLDTMTKALKAHEERMAKRRKRLTNQFENLRTAISVALQQAEIDAMETPLGTISRKKVPPKAIVLEEADIPTEYLKTKVEVDKTKVLKALKDGTDVPGATLSNGGTTIQIRMD
jgi:hypothetical protein